MNKRDDVTHHYGSPDLLERILETLQQSGISLEQLKAPQLYPIDQLHMGGREATRALADKLHLKPGMRILDVGSGLGGTARLLASEYGCHVTALDLTEAFCRASAKLTELTHLSNLIDTVQGDAVDSTLPAASFDLIWCQHTQMNIANKPGLLEEFKRLVKPSGMLALHEVFTGPNNTEAVVYPLPWASDATSSYLISLDYMQGLTESLGFQVVQQRDLSNQAREWWQQRLTRMATPAKGGLGPGLIFGPQSRQFGPNIIDNLHHQRITVHELIFKA